jgi:5-methylcytosine-specific restriction endonuclease McrA
MDRLTRNAINRAIRNTFRQSAVYAEIKESAYSKEKGVRGGKRWDCAHCGKSAAKVEVDHVDPVVPLGVNSYELSIQEYYNKVHCCPRSNLQVLCVPCHNEKSKLENIERKKLLKKRAKDDQNSHRKAMLRT